MQLMPKQKLDHSQIALVWCAGMEQAQTSAVTELYLFGTSV